MREPAAATYTLFRSIGGTIGPPILSYVADHLSIAPMPGLLPLPLAVAGAWATLALRPFESQPSLRWQAVL